MSNTGIKHNPLWHFSSMLKDDLNFRTNDNSQSDFRHDQGERVP